MVGDPDSAPPPARGLPQRPVIRGDRLRLRTLTLIRWVAAAGQTVTVLVVHFGLGFDLPVVFCLAVIATLVASNLVLSHPRVARARIGNRAAAILLGFDIVQLAVLLYVTGGLQNPFAILIIAPVVVSATILSRGATAALTLLAFASISVLAYFRTPLPWSPEVLELPAVYVLGIWTALAVASVFTSTYVWSVSEEARRMSDALAATQTLLARQQRLSDLGGLAAAAAHELGSPLATIAVVAKELSREVPPDSPLAEDVELLLSQSERCRDILAGLARAPETSSGEPFDKLPLTQIVEAAAEPYRNDAIDIIFMSASESAGPEPIVVRSSELLSALGTLIQNAMQFARHEVVVSCEWDDASASVVIHDDGPGFAPAVMTTLGEPFVSTRSDEEDHMGLGIFIAQTLLQRVGADLSFANRDGAEVVIQWPRTMLDHGDGS